MLREWRLGGAVLGVIVLAVAGCSSSPKEELIESADEKCRTINERFTGDLAYGDGQGSDDIPKMRERVKLLKDLRDGARSMPKPETGQAQLDAWLRKLGTYITELDNLMSQMQNARMGMDLLLAMQSGMVKRSAEATGPAAKGFGLKDCANTAKWEHIAS